MERIEEKVKEQIQKLKRLPPKITHWVGTTESIVVHTILFVGAFLLPHFGYDFDKILLIVTTIVSLEAVYLAIFIQMTVNRSMEGIVEVEEDIGEIHEEVKELGTDVEEISKDVEEISEDVVEISEDIDKIQEEDAEQETEEERTKITLEKIETDIQRLLTDIETLKQQNKNIPPTS